VDDTQIVFIDTPGIVEHNKQKNIHRSLLISGWAALEHAELGLYIFF
jgi:GTPase Era involved in 16S rRNA processing